MKIYASFFEELSFNVKKDVQLGMEMIVHVKNTLLLVGWFFFYPCYTKKLLRNLSHGSASAMCGCIKSLLSDFLPEGCAKSDIVRGTHLLNLRERKSSSMMTEDRSTIFFVI